MGSLSRNRTRQLTEQVEYDATRTEWLNERGYRVIRFFNQDVHRHLDAVLETIVRECQRQS